MAAARLVPLTSLALALLATPAASAAPRDLAEIRQRGQLRVLFPDQQTPFFHNDEGEPSGFDLEVLRGFARLQGLEVTPVVVPFDQLVPALDEGRGDVIAGGYAITPERRVQVRFTRPVTPQRHVVVTRAPRPAIEDLAALSGLRVGVAPRSSWRYAALGAGVPENRLVETLAIDPTVLTKAFVDGSIDAAVIGLVFAMDAAEADPELHLGAFADQPGAAHGYAVRSGDTALAAALDGYLDTTRDGPAWYRLVLEHFGPRAPELFRRARG